MATAQTTGERQEKPLLTDKEIGMRTLRCEYAKFGYFNGIQTLGKRFFNAEGIKTAVRHLIAMEGYGERKSVFMDEMSQAPGQWSPRVHLGDKRIGRKFEERLSDEVSVYFLDVRFEMQGQTRSRRKPWHGLVRKFLPGLEKTPGSVETKWYYGSGSKKYSSPDFKQGKDSIHPYQIHARFFGGALTAFSCFVGTDHIEISSPRFYDDDPKNYFKYPSNSGIWKGRLGDFLESAAALEEAIRGIEPEIDFAKHTNTGKGFSRGEVKLFHPKLGMVAMRPEHVEYTATHRDFRVESKTVTDPATLIVNSLALEKLRENLSKGAVF